MVNNLLTENYLREVVLDCAARILRDFALRCDPGHAGVEHRCSGAVDLMLSSANAEFFHVSPQVMESILKDSRQATRGAVGKRKIPVLFTDINGFLENAKSARRQIS